MGSTAGGGALNMDRVNGVGFAFVVGAALLPVISVINGTPCTAADSMMATIS